MVRLSIISGENGKRYWVLKTCFRVCDALCTPRMAKKYNDKFFAGMAATRDLMFWRVGADRFITVCDEIKFTGNKEVLYRSIQRKFHVEFAHCGDIMLNTRLRALVDYAGSARYIPCSAQRMELRVSRNSAFKKVSPTNA